MLSPAISSCASVAPSGIPAEMSDLARTTRSSRSSPDKSFTSRKPRAAPTYRLSRWRRRLRPNRRRTQIEVPPVSSQNPAGPHHGLLARGRRDTGSPSKLLDHHDPNATHPGGEARKEPAMTLLDTARETYREACMPVLETARLVLRAPHLGDA